MKVPFISLHNTVHALSELWKIPLLFLACTITLVPESDLYAHPKPPTYYPNEEHVAKYLNEMPWSYYKSYYVNGLGWFWVDNARDVVKDTIKTGKVWSPHIVQLLERYLKPGDNVIDIGAHMGTMSLAMSNLVGTTGMVYAFECERQFFRELYHNMYSNGRTNVIPHLSWITDVDADVEVFDKHEANYNPVHSPIDESWTLHKHTLDSFALNNIALIKIDVAGAQDEVLSGAQETIAHSRPLLFIKILGALDGKKDPAVKKRLVHTCKTLLNMNYIILNLKGEYYFAIPRERA